MEVKYNRMNQKQLLSAEELEALLARPVGADLNPEKFFPLRLWIIGIAGFFWFIRLTVFTDEVANGLLEDAEVESFYLSHSLRR